MTEREPTCPKELIDEVVGRRGVKAIHRGGWSEGDIAYGVSAGFSAGLAAARRPAGATESEIAKAERAVVEASLRLRKAQLGLIATSRDVGCMSIPGESEAREHGVATREWRDACAALAALRKKKKGGEE